jgi:hypothetical protein
MALGNCCPDTRPFVGTNREWTIIPNRNHMERFSFVEDQNFALTFDLAQAD